MRKFWILSVNRKNIKHYWLYHWVYILPNKWGGNLLGKLYERITRPKPVKSKPYCEECKYWDKEGLR